MVSLGSQVRGSLASQSTGHMKFRDVQVSRSRGEDIQAVLLYTMPLGKIGSIFNPKGVSCTMCSTLSDPLVQKQCPALSNTFA